MPLEYDSTCRVVNRIRTVQTVSSGLLMPTPSYIILEKQLGANNYKLLDVILCCGEGVRVWDVDDKRYLDCLYDYSAVNQGHCHPKIMEARLSFSLSKETK